MSETSLRCPACGRWLGAVGGYAHVHAHASPLAHELHAIFLEAGSELDLTRVRRVLGTPTEKLAHIRALHARLQQLGDLLDRLEGAA